MDGQDDPQTLEVYRLVKEGWTDESGFGGVHSSRRVVGFLPGPGEGRGLLGAAVPEPRPSHEAWGRRTVASRPAAGRKAMTTSS